MLQREDVLHVAKLARLELTDEEVDHFAVELAKVLDYIEKIEELKLDDVKPTTHVVELQDVLRPDEPEPCLDRDVILANAPDAARGGFRVPSPGANA